MDQRIGQQIGNYRIVDIIDKGSYGLVYRAEHIYIGHSCAIKFLHTYLNAPQLQTAFLQEATILARLTHPHIVRLLDYGIDEGTPYLVSEYASGGSLRTVLRDHAPMPLALDHALAILNEVGNALTSIHAQGIIHRDLKPENILFGQHGNVLLADFGIATVKQVTGMTNEGRTGNMTGLGTPAYMAPEQFQSKQTLTPASDQYALGCLAYELFTGQLPFTPADVLAYGYLHVHEPPDSLRHLNPALPVALDHAVLTALAKNPADRHASIEAFLAAVDSSLSSSTQLDLQNTVPEATQPASPQGSNEPTVLRGRTKTRVKTATQPAPLGTQQQATQFETTLPRSLPLPTTRIASGQDTDGPVAVPPTSSRWKRLAGASALTRTKWLFLFAAIIDIPLLLSSFWWGNNPALQVGTILAVMLCICGLALNFFLEPWLWLVLFLLFSPLAGALYSLAVPLFSFNQGSMNWRTYCTYLLLTPGAGLLYGVFAPTTPRTVSMNPTFTKKMILTLWCLGAALFFVGLGTPLILFLGLAWVVASAVLAVAQLIRLKQWQWLGRMSCTVVIYGLPLLFWGFAYGAFGPTLENE